MAFSFKISNRSAENLKFLFSSLSVCFFLSFALLTLARVLMLLVFAFDQYIEIPDTAKINFFVLGARYDLKVIGIAFALPLITGMLTFAAGFFDKVKKVMVPFNYLMIFILGIFCVINYFYYRTYYAVLFLQCHDSHLGSLGRLLNLLHNLIYIIIIRETI